MKTITWKRWGRGAYCGNVESKHIFRIFREHLDKGKWWVHDMRTRRKDGKAEAYPCEILREAKEVAVEIL